MIGTLIDRLMARRYPRKTLDEIAANVDAEHEATGRVVAARFTRGNVNIQEGRYLTKGDLKRRRATFSR